MKSTKTRETWEKFEHAQTKVTFVVKESMLYIHIKKMSAMSSMGMGLSSRCVKKASFLCKKAAFLQIGRL